MKKIIIILFLLLINNSWSAEESKSVETINKRNYNQETNKFTLDFVYASEQMISSDDHKVNGIYTSIKTSLLYTLNPVDEFRLYASYTMENFNQYEDKKYFEFGEFMYRRKSILNTDEHGVNLDLELKHGIVLDSGIRKYWGFDSETIPQLIFKKKLTDTIGLEFKARHHFFHRNKTTPATLAHEDRLFLSGYKMLGHQYILNTEIKYRHKIYTGAHFSHHRGGFQNINHEDLVLRPGILVFMTRQALIEGYFETKLNDTFDTRSTNTLLKDEMIFGAAIYLTAF